MRIHRNWITALFCTGLIACGRGSPDTTTPRDQSRQSTEADSTARPEREIAATLIGDWELDRIPPQRLPGLNITVTIDSATGARYFGRLSHYFSGNVGQDPREYVAFSDSIRQDGSLTFVVPAVDRSMPGMMMAGVLNADTIQLDKLAFGPDTIRSGSYQWILVRKP